MAGVKYGWLLNYDLGTADYYHRMIAALFVVLTLVSIVYEVIRNIKDDQKKLAWFVVGKTGYQFFTFMTTIIFIITGAMIWVCMDSNVAAFSFALFIHENLTYIVLGSLVWHIYMKCHALLWPKKPASAPPGEGGIK